ncbi:MAG: hypothetical protein AAGH45_02265 [Pseudomonadota bacterium]
MTLFFVLVTIVPSLIALGYLIETDPKRRRAFREPALGHERYIVPPLALLVLPGGATLAAGTFGLFVLWFSTLTVVGWIMAALSPDAWRRIGARLEAWTGLAFRRVEGGR